MLSATKRLLAIAEMLLSLDAWARRFSSLMLFRRGLVVLLGIVRMLDGHRDLIEIELGMRWDWFYLAKSDPQPCRDDE